MRTDSVALAREAVAEARTLIERDYGPRYRPAEPRVYRSTAKNAQEAHEAIRPTSIERTPASLARSLDPDQARLYELVWKRTVASQMSAAVFDRMTVDIDAGQGAARLRAVGTAVAFDGFLALYDEGRDDPNGEDDGRMLPAMAKGDAPTLVAARPERHVTEPPPRYSEASLVKKLEELGIGRPSTYASILSVLQDRKYVRLERKRFVPEDRGRLVTAFLESFFKHYVEYDFTADLENRLDDVSNGTIDWKELLREFWRDFSGAVEGTRELRVKDVLEALDSLLGPHFFRADDPAVDPRACPGCGRGRLSLKLGRFGAFIGCSNYPECRYTRRLAVPEEGNGNGAESGPRELGTDPATGQPVTLRQGPYGAYVQLGAGGEGEKPKRASLPKGADPAAIDLEKALRLLALPRTVGIHPETGAPILAGLGRFGPYLKHGERYATLPAAADVLEIGLNRALDILANARERRRFGEMLRSLGEHPEDGAPVVVKSGRYGPYVQHGRTFASLPKGGEPDAVTLEDAVALLAARAARGSAGRARRAPGAKAARTKAAAKPQRKAAASMPKSTRPTSGGR
jgi:DNA topoisomerase-1